MESKLLNSVSVVKGNDKVAFVVRTHQLKTASKKDSTKDRHTQQDTLTVFSSRVSHITPNKLT